MGLNDILDRAGIERDTSKRVIPYLKGSAVDRVREVLFEDLELTAASGPVKTSAPPHSAVGPSTTGARSGDGCGGARSSLKDKGGCVGGGRSDTDSEPVAATDGGCGGGAGRLNADDGDGDPGGC